MREEKNHCDSGLGKDFFDKTKNMNHKSSLFIDKLDFITT